MDATDRALALLERERRALLSADWEALDRIAPLKARLAETLGAQPEAGLTPRRLAEIRRAAGRNGAIMTAAMEGLRDGARRLQEIRRAQSGFSSYDSAGRQARVASTRPGLEKRS
ncbi:flagellar biosynthesis protein FlgN [Pseudoroseicyclus aestuarii]|uniref:FlgN protein n=1 Tax=Pseudoroseicyclus aestuarii TaxID=1795041 RepID=A0A318SXL4_9RHOB|nr:flagellar biosynthesis protein FlgN [Pseudoroseicyclus aestuarii]PYE84567.1 hypothetical protein DFP88_102368 [Pseudoroseicyclus aestuarii]